MVFYGQLVSLEGSSGGALTSILSSSSCLFCLDFHENFSDNWQATLVSPLVSP